MNVRFDLFLHLLFHFRFLFQSQKQIRFFGCELFDFYILLYMFVPILKHFY